MSLSHGIEVNPGPRPSNFPCGSCGKAVRNGQNSIQCDGCNSWFHIECEGLVVEMHRILGEHESYSWVCLTCGLPNVSTGFFDDTLSTLHTPNIFSLLDMDAPCPATSTPLKQVMYKPPTEPKKLKILNINFQSIVN